MTITPSIMFYAALLCWPLVSVALYRRYDLNQFLILSLIMPYLFLPEFPIDPSWRPPFNLPILPPLDKNNIPILTIVCILISSKIKIKWIPEGFMPRLLIAFIVVGPIFTIVNNADPIHLGQNYIPALSASTYPSLILPIGINCVIPFLLGYTFLHGAEQHKQLISYVAKFGLFYALLMLYEIRMSPQLHTEIYGYFPHDWRQQYRDGGFRPVVFLGHGLLVAFFCVQALLAVRAMWIAKINYFRKYGALLVFFLLGVLYLCKTYSAIAYAVLAFGVLKFLPRNFQYWACASVALVVLAYPLARSYMPLDAIHLFASEINEARAQSLFFRLKNEEVLLDKANERPIFGWGSWGRNLVYDEDSGERSTVPDGAWIVFYGKVGIVGYIGLFGLIGWPLLAMALKGNYKKLDSDHEIFTLTLMVISMLVLLNQIPNSSLNPIPFLIAGALLGRVKGLSIKDSSLVSSDEA